MKLYKNDFLGIKNFRTKNRDVIKCVCIDRPLH